MPTVQCTSRANLDLVEIALYIAKQNPVAADRWLERIDEKCRRLAQMPKLGRARPDLAPGLRSLAVGSYVIFYRPASDGIQVIRIVHGSRDVSQMFD